MKTLIFKNGGTIDFVECYSEGEYIQGAQRDVLDFRFDPSAITLDAVDKLFSAEECGKLTIRETIKETVTEIVTETITEQEQVIGEDGKPVLDEEGNPVMQEVERTVETPIEKEVERVEEFIWDDYSLRVALRKQKFTLATENGAEDVEQISVKMGQLTYVEKQVASLTDTVDVLVLESLMG